MRRKDEKTIAFLGLAFLLTSVFAAAGGWGWDTGGGQWVWNGASIGNLQPEFEMKFKVTGTSEDSNGYDATAGYTILTMGIADSAGARGDREDRVGPELPPPPVPGTAAASIYDAQGATLVASLKYGQAADEGTLIEKYWESEDSFTWIWRFDFDKALDEQQPARADGDMVMSWGEGGDFVLPTTLPPNATLYLVRDENGDGDYEDANDVFLNLLVAGSITVTEDAVNAVIEDDQGDPIVNEKGYMIVYRNVATLTPTVQPVGAVATAAKWFYRPAGTDYSPDDNSDGWLDATAAADNWLPIQMVWIHPGEYEVFFSSVGTVEAITYYAPAAQNVEIEAQADLVISPYSVTGVYQTVQATAGLVVQNGKYSPKDQKLYLDCSYEFSSEISLDALLWTINGITEAAASRAVGDPVAGTISALTGADAALFDFDAGTSTVSLKAGSVPLAGTSLEFTIELDLPVLTEPYPALVIDTKVDGTVEGGGAPSADLSFDFDPVTAQPQTATLDVEGDGDYDVDDIVLIYKKWYAYDPAVAGGVPAAVALNMIVAGNAVAAQKVVDDTEAMGDALDMDQDSDTDVDDLVLIYKKWYAYDPAVAGGVPAAVALNMIIAGDAAAAAYVVQQVEAFSPDIN